MISVHDSKVWVKVGERLVCPLTCSGQVGYIYRHFLRELRSIAKWERPYFAMLFYPESEEIGVFVISNAISIVDAEGQLELIDFSAFGLCSNADIEEIVFALCRRLIDGLKDERVAEILDISTEKLADMSSRLECELKRAERLYNYPEFIKAWKILINGDELDPEPRPLIGEECKHGSERC